MPNHPTDQALVLQRDGVSQARRQLAALAPDSIAVDERSLKDLLAFARQYAKELRYYNLHNRVEGDWSAFLNPDLPLDDLIAFVRDPDAAPPQKAQKFRQPHVVLFLTFLQLLRHAQQQMNTLTQRHLDFYYQQVLQMTKRPAVPDHIHVLLELAAGVERVLVPAGTRLQAGTDSLGQDRFYQTERAVVATRAQVARLSSLYVEKQVTGIREARELHDGPKDEQFMKMLELALGDPNPGDPLPPYAAGHTVDFSFLEALFELVKFAPTDLCLELFELRELMRLKHQRDQGDADWARINQLLEGVGRKRTKDDDFRLHPRDPRDFDANLAAALGGAPNFDGLTEVDTIYDLYEEHNQRRQDVQQFIHEQLFFENINDFDEMMRIKVRIIDRAWQEINRLLAKAGRQKKGDAYTPPSSSASPAFLENLNAAVGPINFAAVGVENIDDYYAAVVQVEQFFFMPAENFAFIMEAVKNEEATLQDWDSVYNIMAKAYQEKVYAARREKLKSSREADGLDAMLRLALGDALTTTEEAPLLEQLKNFLKRKIDRESLDIAIRDQEWDEIYHIVEIAQRNRENFPVPVARKEDWRHLYPFADATAVSVAPSSEQKPETSRWKTFGRVQRTGENNEPPPPSFGWAFCSPLLSLSQGVRTITLTLGFAPKEFDDNAISPLLDRNPFEVQLTTENDWVEPETVSLQKGKYAKLSGVPDSSTEPLPSLAALQLKITVNEQVDPIAPLSEGVAVIPTPWPVLRLRLRPLAEDAGRYRTPYQPFKDLTLLKVHVEVDVTGLTELQLENDETALDPSKPFEPFGTAPAVGSRFSLGHPELVAKKLDRLDFHLEWMGVPEKLEEHYKNYDAANLKGNASFTVNVNLVDKRLIVPLNSQTQLFSKEDASTPHTITLTNVPPAAPGADVRTWDRYLQWELNAPDFQHAVYPAVVMQKSIALATDNPKKEPDAYQVNPPYTPKLKNLSVDYTSSTEVVLTDYHTDRKTERIFHVHPFGYSEIQPEPDTSRYPFLPQYDHEGELYIGLRDAAPPQTLAVLFQMAEGSADPDVEQAQVQWSYLSNNRWESLGQGNILLDTTRGLRNTGLLEFSLPLAQPNTMLASDLYWIRAAIAQHNQSICDTVAIHTNAVSAIFVDQHNAPEHFSKPLPTGTITELVEPRPEVSAIRQPYTSYGGAGAEQDSHLYLRVSERLRHKQRALTAWDYERLILQQFPQIYKVKCLPANLQTHPDEPGRVEIIVIPDIKNSLPFNPFEPKAPANLLADITTYLSDKKPSFAAVAVRNASYVPVKVRFAVRFRPGGNEGFYKQKLNEELVRFLSPWAYEGGADIVLGGRIYANTLINFIEERPYVDYVAEVKLFTSEDLSTFRLAVPSLSEGYYATTARPDSVLVTVRQHEIDMITEADYKAENFRGINYMKIELDFIVAEDRTA